MQFKDFHRSESYSPIIKNDSSEESYEKDRSGNDLFTKKNHSENNYPK